MTINHDEHQIPDAAIAERSERSLNRLAKWRSVFAGWQLGTRRVGDPESDAVRDHRELSMLMRAELTTIALLLIDKGVFTLDEYNTQLAIEADSLSHMFERRFPGMKATDEGITLDAAAAAKTTKNWRP